MRSAMAVAAFLLFAGPAQAATLGTLTLSASSGTVSHHPMLTGATTSAVCPSGYGTNAAIKVGRPNGPYSNLNTIGSAGNYSSAPFTLAANRSMARALTGSDSGAVADGAYEIVVLCAGEILGDHPDHFTIGITVSGGSWQVGAAPGNGATSGEMNITATVGAGQTSPTPTSPPSGPLPRTGASIIGYVSVGLLLVGVGIAAVRFFRKQHRL